MSKKKRSASGDRNEAGKEEPSVDFEEALADVESIVAKLEGGELGLTDSLQQYEIGVKRLKQCHALLQQAERRVTLLSGVDEDGNVIGEPFHVDENQDQPAANGPERKKPIRGARTPVADSVDDLPGLF